jgi:hypothetical protein
MPRNKPRTSKREAEKAAANKLAGRVLLVSDRSNGATERLSDGNVIPSVYSAAQHLGISFAEAVDKLLDGQTLITTGFTRALEAM